MNSSRLIPTALCISAVLAIAGCSATAIDDSAFKAFSLNSSSSGWYDSNERAGDSNFRGERVGDLCGFASDIRSSGGALIGSPQMVARDGDLSEQTVFSALYAVDPERIDELFAKLSSELVRCSEDVFSNSTEDGILISKSVTNDVERIDDSQNLTGVASDLVIMFDYVRIEKSSILNTNNDYTDDSQYESQGRVIVIRGNDSVLLITSSGRSWENYGTSPSISEQNFKISNEIKTLLG